MVKVSVSQVRKSKKHVRDPLRANNRHMFLLFFSYAFNINNVNIYINNVAKKYCTEKAVKKAFIDKFMMINEIASILSFFHSFVVISINKIISDNNCNRYILYPTGINNNMILEYIACPCQ